MNKRLILGSIMSLSLVACQTPKETNPLLLSFNTPYGIPPFDKIEVKHFKPAFLEAIKQVNEAIKTIVASTDEPTFENTVLEFQYSDSTLVKIQNVFFNLTASIADHEIDAVNEEITPILTEHADKILLNEKLFNRIQVVYEKRNSSNLNGEQIKVVEEYYKHFVRAGANIAPEHKEELMKINKDLSSLELKFGNNTKADNNAFELYLTDQKELAGLPTWLIEQAASEAKNRKKDNGWIFSIDRPSVFPFLTYSSNRELRKKIYEAYTLKGNNGNENDNNEIIVKIANLRLQKAKLLGFPTWAHFRLDNTMAKTPEVVDRFLLNLWGKAQKSAHVELADMLKLAQKEDGVNELEAYDWFYYAEKVRKERYDLDEDEVKPYFKLENVRDGVFAVANKLWGIKFNPLAYDKFYHPEVQAFEVVEASGDLVGILLVDYFPRSTKRGGAWMSNFRNQQILRGENIRPIIVNVGNFTKPTETKPSLLSSDDVNTLFHEFGHALHGLFANTTYPLLSGTNVARDFVELPSQIMENWAFHPEVLKIYAKHYLTGETIPDHIIAKINESGKFNQGFATTEYLAASILDMKWMSITEPIATDAKTFETQVLQSIGLIRQIAPRYRSTYFNHIFAGESYSSGYYSYIWAEVLDADAFESFEKTSIFDQKTAESFRRNILERGGTEDPMNLYLRFKGQAPSIEPLLRNRGLK